MFKLTGKRALVTGASSGIGRAAAVALSAMGAEVVAAARREDKLREVARETGARYVVADISTPAGNQAALDAAGPVDILVSNAGGPLPGPATQVTDEQWNAGFDLTFMSTVRLAQGVLGHMQQQGWGRIIAVTSLTVGRPSLNLPISNAMRAAVTNYLRTLALEVGPSGVTCNTVAPGYTSTERLEQLHPDEASRQKITNRIPLRRFAEASEVAAAIAFLSSQEAGYVTGQELLVDGGWGI